MTISRRREIIEWFVTQLKLINGSTSTFDNNYTYINNLFNKVERKLKFIDEINDFPFLCLSVGEENRIYDSKGLTTAELPVSVFCYVQSEKATNKLEGLIQDIEHVVYHLPIRNDLGILDAIVESISTDEGLIEPFGMGNVTILFRYELIE